MTTTIGYLRVSTDEQVDSGLGLEAQRAAINAEAARRELTVSTWFADEGISGAAGIEKRPGLAGALEALKRGDVLIVAKRDRLARDALLSAWIEKEATRARATIVSAAGEGNGTDPTAMLMRRVIDAFAEFERHSIKARTKAALAAKRARGERTSRYAPYGWKHVSGRLVTVEHEQRGRQLALNLRGRGASLREISSRLFRDGFAGRSGNALSPQVVSNMLKEQNV